MSVIITESDFVAAPVTVLKALENAKGEDVLIRSGVMDFIVSLTPPKDQKAEKLDSRKVRLNGLQQNFAEIGCGFYVIIGKQVYITPESKIPAHIQTIASHDVGDKHLIVREGDGFSDNGYEETEIAPSGKVIQNIIVKPGKNLTLDFMRKAVGEIADRNVPKSVQHTGANNETYKVWRPDAGFEVSNFALDMESALEKVSKGKPCALIVRHPYLWDKGGEVIAIITPENAKPKKKTDVKYAKPVWDAANMVVLHTLKNLPNIDSLKQRLSLLKVPTQSLCVVGDINDRHVRARIWSPETQIPNVEVKKLKYSDLWGENNRWNTVNDPIRQGPFMVVDDNEKPVAVFTGADFSL